TGNTTVGTQFAKRVGVLAGVVGSDAYGFADYCYTTATARCCQGVLVCPLWIFFQQTAGHHQVLGNPASRTLFEVAQLSAGYAVQLLTGNVLIDIWGLLAVCTVRNTQIARVVGTWCVAALVGKAILACWAFALRATVVRAVEATTTVVVALETATTVVIATFATESTAVIVTLEATTIVIAIATEATAT